MILLNRNVRGYCTTKAGANLNHEDREAPKQLISGGFAVFAVKIGIESEYKPQVELDHAAEAAL
jgi:hypothetical protein